MPKSFWRWYASNCFHSAARQLGQSSRRWRWGRVMRVGRSAGVRTLAFAAAIMAMQTDDEVSGNVLVGRYGAELALMLDASNRYDRPSVAVSDNLTGQAIAYALAQDVLIGEEIFAAPAYLSEDISEAKRVMTTDVLRYVLIAAIVALAIAMPIFGNGA